MTGTSPVIFRQTGNTLLLSGQWEKGKDGHQAELHCRQVKFEIPAMILLDGFDC